MEACSGPLEYDADMGDRSMLIVEPPSIEQRIINQYSFSLHYPPVIFLMLKNFSKNIPKKTTRFIIKKEIRWQVRDLSGQAEYK